MKITQVSEQGGNIREFYTEFLLREEPADRGTCTEQHMLRLLDYLEQEEVAGPSVWCVTSHFHLSLGWRPWAQQSVFVGWYGAEYHIAFPWDSNDAPWPHASIEGSTSDVANAAAMIQVALKRIGPPIGELHK